MDVSGFDPRPILQARQQALDYHRRFENEPPPALQNSRDCPQELRIPLIVQIPETVSVAERAIESIPPWQIAHVALFPNDAPFRIGGASVTEEFSRQVHTGHPIHPRPARERRTGP